MVVGCFDTVQQSAAAVSCSQSELLQNQLFFVKGILPATAVPTQSVISDRYKFQHSTTSQASQGKQQQRESSQFGNNKQRGHSFINMIQLLVSLTLRVNRLVSFKSNNNSLPSFQIYTFLREDHLVEIDKSNQDIYSVYQLHHHQVQRHRESCFSSVQKFALIRNSSRMSSLLRIR